MSSTHTATLREEMYINGEFTEHTTGNWIPVYDPSTEEILAEVVEASAVEVDIAVQAARGSVVAASATSAPVSSFGRSNRTTKPVSRRTTPAI